MSRCSPLIDWGQDRAGRLLLIHVYLAAAILGIGGLGFVASKVDPGFADVFREAVVKVRINLQSIPTC